MFNALLLLASLESQNSVMGHMDILVPSKVIINHQKYIIHP